ncbi:MAG: hypothetical protein HGA54_05995 [Actinobacteria bacterium]|nr:hypothetical protein [Actinomycetota bacterium]
MQTTKHMRGTRVLGGKKGKRKIGKVSVTVFHPEEPRVVGYIVKRPDILWMIKRSDKFIAFDACEMVDGRIVAKLGNDSWDEAATKRLGIDYDKCILWENMPIKTEDGFELGHVGVVAFNDYTGKVTSISSSDGAAARAILGAYEIPVEMISGYNKGYLVVSTQARDVEASGGVAAKAGRTTAKATKSLTVASVKAGNAINESAYALGGLIGKAKSSIESITEDVEPEDAAQPALGESGASEAETKVAEDVKSSKTDVAARAVGEHLGKTKGMFSSFKEEYKKGASKDD